ncbi:MAG: ChaN family lipoprotein [Gemmatimonadota bacterium]|nr:MAG: ChaN family lipoprotein [Gemmatimonadota bacterium]
MNRSLVFPATMALLVFSGTGLAAQGVGSPTHSSNAHVHSSESALQDTDYAGHFQVFTGEGEPASLEDIVRAMAGADAVLIGESHTDPVGHWIQAHLLREVLAGAESDTLRPVALSLEMFERDVQDIVDEYLQDLITEDQFQASARPWTHYDADYRPMVELAKEAGIPVIAANAPRRYVNRVTRLGRAALNDLPSRARGFLPPLPYPQPSDAYREEWLTLMAEMPMERTCDPPVAETAVQERAVADTQEVVQHHPPADEPPPTRAPAHMESFMENGLHAQALWDASMAYAVTGFLDANPGALVLHMVGGFHVENYTGIPEQVQHYRPGTRSLVVSMDTADDFRSFDPEEHKGRGDFVILTDQSLDLEYARYCTDPAPGP